jgi:aspartate racemase
VNPSAAKKRIVGVIGGMGPAATVHFMSRVLDLTPAASDQDHLRLIVDNNGGVLDRNAAVGGAGPSPAPVLVAMARGLERAGAEMLVMPCNTAHAFAGAIRAASDLPFVDLIEAASDEAMAHRASRVGVLAADGCLQAGLYQHALQHRHVTPVFLEPRAQAEFMSLLHAIKAGDRGPGVRAGMKDLAGALVAAGAQALVAGCTEVPLVLGPHDVAVPLTDSIDALARATIAAAIRTPKVAAP